MTADGGSEESGGSIVDEPDFEREACAWSHSSDVTAYCPRHAGTPLRCAGRHPTCGLRSVAGPEQPCDVSSAEVTGAWAVTASARPSRRIRPQLTSAWAPAANVSFDSTKAGERESRTRSDTSPRSASTANARSGTRRESRRSSARQQPICASGGRRFVSDRAKPLLAFPLVGTGAGGAATRKGHIVDAVLNAAFDFVSTHEVDAVLVTNSAAAHAAAQSRRRELAHGARGWFHGLPGPEAEKS